MEKIELFKQVNEFTNVNVFQNHTPIYDVLPNTKKKQGRKQYVWNTHKIYQNSKEKYLEHYGDKLSEISLVRKTVVIEKIGDKISLKYFYYESYRNPGVHWFSKKNFMDFLTLNTKTGILYTGHIGKLRNKKRTKKIFTNKFWYSPETYFVDAAYALQARTSSSTHEMTENRQISKKLMDIFFSNVPGFEFMVPENMYNKLGASFHRYYLTKKGVKLPDNFINYNQQYSLIPNAKSLKKAKNKFIDAVMIQNGISGDKVRKILHETQVPPTLDSYKFFMGLVGQDRLHQDDKMLNNVLTYPNNNWSVPSNLYEDLSDSERKNAWSCVKDGMMGIQTLKDHLVFLKYLKDEGLNFKWKAKTKPEFNIEHKRLSDEFNRFKYGILNRKYPQGYRDFFKEPLKVGGINYKVVLLETHHDFYSESEYQSNCVKTYLSRPGSLILSVRDGKDWATVEYTVRSFRYKWLVERPQSLGRFNEKLNEHWDVVLSWLDVKVEELLSEHGYDFTLSKQKGDMSIEYNLEWDDEGRAKWNDTIDKINPFDYFF